jgi:hypothetical protein
VDRLQLRADGRIDLDTRIIIETKDGQRSAESPDGVRVPRVGEPIAEICEDVSLATSAEDDARVNTRQIWGAGTVHFATGKIHIDAYTQ